MTDKYNTSDFNLDAVKKMTDKLNNFDVAIRVTSFYYPGHAAFSEPYEFDKKVPFSELIGEFAYLYRAGMTTLFDGLNERFIAEKLGEDIGDVFINPDIYNNHFLIVRHNSLSYKLFKKDILFIFEDDNYFLVSNSPISRSNFRKLRGIK